MKYIFCFAIVCMLGIALYNALDHDTSIDKIIPYLGHHIDSIPDINDFTKHKIVVKDDEDERLQWFGLDYKKQDKVIFSLEGNWVNPDIVSRIIILDSCVKSGDIYVGQKFGCIRHLINPDIPVSPDGELFVEVKNTPSIHLQLSARKLSEDIASIYDIPDSIRVEMIVVQ